MARAQGINARLALAFETDYGTPPEDGFLQMPFVSSGLGDDQPLIASDLLGFGRDPVAPELDIITNTGDLVVPIDLRYFGHWLKAVFGPPATTQVKATGSLLFASQPGAASTITVNGQVFTFVVADPGANDIEIGVNLGATITAIAAALNASAVAGVAEATYGESGGNTVTISHDAGGDAGNAFTLVAGAGSHATPSGATLSGGYSSHVFASAGADDTIPSFSAETGLPDIPRYVMTAGGRANTLAFSAKRGGWANATIGVIAQGDLAPTTESAAGEPSELDILRFVQRHGSIKKDGSLLGNVVSWDATYSNGMDALDTVGRPDGKIDGADAAAASWAGSIVVRLSSGTLIDDVAKAGVPIALELAYTRDATKAIVLTAPVVYLPVPKTSVSGPGGIQATFAWQAAQVPGESPAVTVTLKNDVASYG